MNEGSSRFFVLNIGKCTEVYGRIVVGFGRLVVNEACRYLLVITCREVNNEAGGAAARCAACAGAAVEVSSGVTALTCAWARPFPPAKPNHCAPHS